MSRAQRRILALAGAALAALGVAVAILSHVDPVGVDTLVVVEYREPVEQPKALLTFHPDYQFPEEPAWAEAPIRT